jgi:hypothetical protein
MRLSAALAGVAVLPLLATAQTRNDAAFDDAYRRLQQGPAYTAQKTGLIRLTNNTGDGTVHHFAVTIPDSYDPSRKYPVRFHLHGGVTGRRSNVPPANAGGIGAIAGDDEQIYVVPFAWDAAPWWTDDQLENLHGVLQSVKRLYNVDENRVYLSGVSDGGTGTYYMAMRDTTPYAAFLPLNGYWGVLANRDLMIDTPLFPGNLRNKPLFIVNGERDPLYPTSAIDPVIAHYKRIGLVVDYRPQPGAGHNTSWWPTVKSSFEAFARAHPRNPLPDTLTWETASTVQFNRAHWLAIDKLGYPKTEAKLDDPNLIESEPRQDFGVRSIGNRINRVTPGSNAEKLGLRAGDAFVRLNNETVRINIDVEEVFARLTPGDSITVLVARNNEPVELTGVYAPQTVVDPPHGVFARGVPSGRVDLVRSGNTVTAKTRGVTAFTLLLSPDQFDFEKPITVVVNGKTVHNAKVTRDIHTLEKWAGIDHDRTMLFGAELKIKVN